MLDPSVLREDFPLLMKRNLIYFDNAATSQKPLQVIEAMRNFYENINSNIHRGVYSLSMEASRAYEDAREVVKDFIRAKYLEEVVFTSGATQSLNIVAYMLAPKLSPGDNIVVSIMEHHSNMLPWVRISKLRGVELRVVRLSKDYVINYEELTELIDKKTKIIAISHMSNVLGTIVDIRAVSKLARENESFLVVDGAQSVPHMPVSVRDLDVDFLVFSGHKMLGPTGIGVLYIKKEIQEFLEPPFTGGGTVEDVTLKNGTLEVKFLKMPWSLEAGTPNIAGAIGLSEAIKYLSKVGMENVILHEKALTAYTLKEVSNDELLSKYVKIYGPTNLEVRGGIVAFNIDDMNPNLVASFMDAYNVAVRSGYHCAQPLHEYIGAKLGTVRASYYIYNTKEEISLMIDALRELVKNRKILQATRNNDII
ncbi:MAG: cysteine desulfurase [Zestosphaera sp.]